MTEPYWLVRLSLTAHPEELCGHRSIIPFGNVHCGFAAANTCMLEMAPDYAGLHSEIIDGGLNMKDGYVLPPERPGFGVILTDEIKARYSFKPGSGEFNSVPGKVLTD